MSDAPAQRPQRTIKTWWVFTALGAVIAAAVIIFGIQRSNEPEPSLCDLLRSGWTGDEIVDSDQWRDWPDNMSRMERSMAVTREAGRDCPEQIGL